MWVVTLCMNFSVILTGFTPSAPCRYRQNDFISLL